MIYDCSYSQFTRHVPQNIVKLKPEDWGTSLCMTCINPELKLEAIKKVFPSTTLTLYMMKDGNHKLLIMELFNQIKTRTKSIRYLEWSKEKGPEVKSTTYHSKKNALESDGEEFAKKFEHDVENLEQHAKRFKAQYRRIAELKNTISETTISKLIRIDWSENAELYQTRENSVTYGTFW